jgi:thioredoxin reductase
MRCDAIVVGGSYAGLSAALQLVRARLGEAPSGERREQRREARRMLVEVFTGAAVAAVSRRGPGAMRRTGTSARR